MKHLLVSLAVLCSFAAAGQAPSDSLQTERRSNQNVLLNASSASQPRIISLGIPQWGTPIMEDGLPTAMYSDFFPGFWSWRSGFHTETMELTRLDESALQLGNAGFYPMSTSKMFSDRFSGAVSYMLDHHGRNEIELALTAPLGRGWSLSASAYQDLNRGSNHLDMTFLQEHIQFYRAGIAKKFDGGQAFATYQYSKKLLLPDTNGPFVFVGDGSVKQFNDFVLGRDQYFPATSSFDYIDVRTGENKTLRFVEESGIPTHVMTAGLKYQFANGVELNFSSRLRFSHCDLPENYLGSISEASAEDGFTRVDGTPYSGLVQTRYLTYFDADCSSWFTTAKLSGRKGRSEWTAGANAWINWTDSGMTTSNFAHEAKKDPGQLKYLGEMYYVHNTSTQYVKGDMGRYAAFGQNQWLLGRLLLRTGARLEYQRVEGNGAHSSVEGNLRCNGWSLASPGVKLTPFEKNHLNGALTLTAIYKLTEKTSLELNALATQQHSELWQYGEAELPTALPKRNYLARFGVNYKNSWLDAQSVLMYYRQDNNFYNNFWTHELTKPGGGFPAGYNETVFVGSLYSMTVLGWTTDVIMTPFEGFNFHGLLTVRSPRYSDYKFQPTFSDGYSELYDFSGKYITETSCVELELEPSYSYRKWRFWASARYYSKQYVNITNSLFFKPRWETFAGVDFTASDKVALSLNVINFLNERGAKAGIQAASLATDPAPFQNYLTSGTFIRPLTFEFKTTVQF